MRCLMGIDLGSSSIRSVVYALDGTQLAIASRPTEKRRPDPADAGKVVWPHDRIWNNACEAIAEALAQLPSGARVEALAVACLGMDGVPVDQDLRELYPFISWHDSRTLPQFERWARDFGADRQFLATGNQLFAFNTAFRLQWMAEHEPEILARTHKWVLIGDYLNMKLCGRLATDNSMASCTLLFDPAAAAWSADILAAAGIDGRLLCEPLPSGSLLGAVTDAAARATGLAAGTPVVLGGHDYLCGVLPVGGHLPGTIVDVAGTWDVVQATVTGFAPSPRMIGRGLTVESHVAPGLYSVFGAAIGGAVLDWFRQEFFAAGDAAAWNAGQTEALESGPNDLLFLPHLAGANCPDVDPFSSAAFVGLRSTHTRADMLSAVCHGLAFQSAAIVETLSDCGVDAERFALVGGGSKNLAAVQSRSDILGRPVEICAMEETTALGAAMLAGLGAGVFSNLGAAYESVRRPGVTVKPNGANAARFARRMAIYRDLYATLKSTSHALRDVDAS